MNSNIFLDPGTQIAYLPREAQGDINHSSVSFGFVQEDRGASCLCRFWAKDRKHKVLPGELATKANAVSVYKTDLVRHTSHKQSAIDGYLRVRGGQKLADRKMWGMLPGARQMR